MADDERSRCLDLWPNFSTSPSSQDNKFLWDIAWCIFVELVKCRDYTGVSLESNGMAMIKKAVQAHIQSLANGNLSSNSVSSQIITYSCQSFFKSRYQKQSWDAERLKSQSNTIGRTSRLRYVSCSCVFVLWSQVNCQRTNYSYYNSWKSYETEL